ncbi:MAG: HAMP domain-containing sensor histidine kinase [Lachnospiraceae bacterium]|nr:HAMP domain-containing sensor histidine kinase [Lachnospiraceae bacterium]
MFRRRTLDRLDQMLDEAMNGTFCESDYDESRLSRTESKWKHFLGASVLARENIEKEKDRIKELVSDISHQTKTSMANIRLYTELLSENLEAESDTESMKENQKILEEINRQVEKLDFLIQSLTKMSRLESNIVMVEPKQQAVSRLLDAAIKDAIPKAASKEVEIVNTYTGEGKAVYDLKWTKEALFNVLDNAVKYSPKGSKIFVSVTEYELYTAISVKDFGMGIREEELAKIFGRFYRAQEVQQEDGVGIGLYLTREILRRENGYIKVISKPGEGAEFCLYIQTNGM